MINDEITIDFSKIIKALWKKLWLILLIGILSGSATFAYEKYTYIPHYQTSTTMYVRASNQNGITIDSTDILATCLASLKTRLALETISATAGLNRSYSELSSMVSVSQISKSALFKITITGTNPDEITLIANTAAEILPNIIDFIYNIPSNIGVVDYALVPTVPVANDIKKNIIKVTILGMFLTSSIIALRIIYIDWKEDIEKNNTP